MKRLPFLFLLAIGLLLAACSSAAPSTSTPTVVVPIKLPPFQSPAVPTQNSMTQPVQPAGDQALQLAELTDSQGAVIVVVRPLDLNDSQNTLNFNVTLETHSIDLSMDLAVVSMLTTDTGMSVQAVVWDAPLGGHHVSGTLSFPSILEGKPILDDASKLTLIIKEVDASERVFTWDLK